VGETRAVFLLDWETGKILGMVEIGDVVLFLLNRTMTMAIIRRIDPARRKILNFLSILR
jgi:hypothetical protein